MPTKDDLLKKRLLAAILYHRLIELGYAPGSGPAELNHIDFKDDMGAGCACLQQELGVYFIARGVDFLDPNDPQNKLDPDDSRSRFLPAVAVLRATLETFHRLFDGWALETMKSVAAGLLKFEGWELRDEITWNDFAVDLSLPIKDRARQYVFLIRRCWIYKGKADFTSMLTEHNWAIKLGLL